MAIVQEAKKGGHPNKGSLQAYLQDFTKEAIDIIVDTMRTSRNDNIKFAAAKLILDKSIADIKAVEIGGINGEPIKLNLITGADISKYIQSTTSPTGGSTYGQSPIQSSSVAQAGTQDDNSDKSISEVESV